MANTDPFAQPVETVTVLDCMNMDLRSLFDIQHLGRARALTELNLHLNSLTVIENLAGVGNTLISLNLSGNAIRFIDGLDALRVLQELNLASNQVFRVGVCWFVGLLCVSRVLAFVIWHHTHTNTHTHTRAHTRTYPIHAHIHTKQREISTYSNTHRIRMRMSTNLCVWGGVFFSPQISVVERLDGLHALQRLILSHNRIHSLLGTPILGK
jgi:Leucine-rich repeat (LRR) protein